MQKGTISVQTENIFPIIKKFLYSDNEIFLRELVSNAVDATNKLRTLARKGEVSDEIGDTRIEILLDNEANTLTIRDKGIGMSEEEVMKYLNQVAFSSAQEFLDKYKDEASVIGHFGLGFYSAFMVSSKVEVRTKSYKDAPAVQWTCTGEPEYTLEAIDKASRGTDIVLYIDEENKEFLERNRINELLDKYCRFLPVEIQFGTKNETYEEAKEDGETEEKTREVPNIINNPNPAWRKHPSELEDEDYRNFYNELHPYSVAPLFWIHLNIDYPFKLTGILYFPKLGNSIEVQRNKIQLYSNQVYVTDEVKGIVPEFLTLLHGVIDSPDIPLNVSRSYLQSDGKVKKITDYITRKVADRLDEIFRKERETFEEKWPNMSVFVKYGMVTEDKFYDKAQKFVLLENVHGKYATVEDYCEQVREAQTDKDGNLVLLYTNNPDEHASYIHAAEEAGYDVLKLETLIDNHFIQRLEQKLEKTSFKRIDADTLQGLIPKEDEAESVLNEEQEKTLEELFKAQIGENGATVQLKALAPSEMPVMITKPEFMRRMREMSALQGQDMNALPEMYNVVVNTNHPLVAKVLEQNDGHKVSHLYQLALLHQGMLRGDQLAQFVQQSMQMLDK